MSDKEYQYVYGPVPSWRLGSSLGIDPISNEEKVCSFDCIYCQTGKTTVLGDKRKTFVPVSKIIEEMGLLPSLKIDYITLSGRGEPTLAKNLGRIITAIKKLRKEKVAVLTNSSLINREDAQEDLLLADFVVAKLDAGSGESFSMINRPAGTIKFDTVLKGLKDFKSIYKGKLALQIMFIKKNKSQASEIAEIAREIGPDEVQINTPLRPCKVKAIPQPELDKIKEHFQGLNPISVYDAKIKKVEPVSKADTLKRRGKIQ